ncbi:MAG: DNA primase [Gammaproteobacteria bacterium]|nr:DNA primase [Gammaproteobacteria bacterium]
MAGRIPSSFIDELLARVDIVDVIDSRVQLKKAGREYHACCPFHNEKTPSFTVSPDKQFYHCFGCGAHGSALGFLMEYEHLGFVEAAEELATGVSMQVPREAGIAPVEKSHQDLYPVMEKVAAFYQQQLRQHADADRATEYLKGRGLSGEVAARFELGFAPSGWDSLGPGLKAQGVSIEQLQLAGMVVKKDSGGHYDRFRDRIMFPIRDRGGRVIAFGGRLLGGDDGPKYLNSSETSIFHKGRELYGLYQARKAERKLERLVVVEGYMDVVSLAQFGVNNVVATLGTATTRDHLERMFRIVPQVAFCFDGDRAGRQAAWRALENALPVLSEGRQIKFMFLPDGEDPDTLIRQEGKESFETRVTDAVSTADYFFGEMTAAVDLSTIDGRARLVEQSRPLLAKLPEGVFRHMMATQLASIARIDIGALPDLTVTAVRKKPTRAYRAANAVREQGGAPSAVRQAIRLLLHRPTLAGLCEDGEFLADLDLPGLPILRQLVEFARLNPHVSCGVIIEHWRHDDAGRHLAKLAAQPLVLPEDGIEAEFRDLLTSLAAQRDEQQLDALLGKARLGDLSEQEKRQLQQALAAKGEGEA